MMNKENLVAAFANAISEMEQSHFIGTYHWYLDTDDNDNDWAIVMSYMDYDGDGESLYAKLAYQPSNSIMQCDYDIDWLMPYDEITGEVWHTELYVGSPDDAEMIIGWLLDCYKDVCEMFQGEQKR